MPFACSFEIYVFCLMLVSLEKMRVYIDVDSCTCFGRTSHDHVGKVIQQDI